MLWYSLEAFYRGASNEYPQYMFLWRNKKSILWIPPLMWSYVTSFERETCSLFKSSPIFKSEDINTAPDKAYF